MTEPISVSEFKAKCLERLNHVAETGQTLLITKRGKPIARVEPAGAAESSENPLKGSVIFEADLISPLDEHWNATQ